MTGPDDKPTGTLDQLSRAQFAELFDQIPSRNCPLCETGTLKERHERMCASCKHSRKLR